MTEAIAMTTQHQVQMRFLTKDDIDDVKLLCAEWFPIDYPESWYQDITSNPKFYSLAAVYHTQIIGLVICEVKDRSSMNKEDTDILSTRYSSSVNVAYILSLGVVTAFRRHGIASLLLDSLVSYLTTPENHTCKVIYLHVLATNGVAIRFYERRSFNIHSFLPYYYSIQSKPRDGYCYVLYINGGEPPWSILDYLGHCGSVIMKIQACTFPSQLIHGVRKWFSAILHNTTGNT